MQGRQALRAAITPGVPHHAPQDRKHRIVPASEVELHDPLAREYQGGSQFRVRSLQVAHT
jgi:hypothetical protein